MCSRICINGISNLARGNRNIAVGYNSKCDGLTYVRQIAIGAETVCYGDGTIAIGDSTNARENCGIAIGRGAYNNKEQGVAIGGYACNYVPKWVSFDGTTSSYRRTLSLYDMSCIFFRNEDIATNKSTQAQYTSGWTLDTVLTGINVTVTSQDTEITVNKHIYRDFMNGIVSGILKLTTSVNANIGSNTSVATVSEKPSFDVYLNGVDLNGNSSLFKIDTNGNVISVHGLDTDDVYCIPISY